MSTVTVLLNHYIINEVNPTKCYNSLILFEIIPQEFLRSVQNKSHEQLVQPVYL